MDITGPQRILVVDDDNLMRVVIIEALAPAGYDILEADSGVSAWEILQKDDAPEIILIDWMMPDLDGLEVIKLLRAKEARKFAHVILLTSRDRKTDIVEGLRAGANDYISKPFHIQELQARVAIGAETVRLRAELAGRIAELEEAMSRITKLEKLLPICSYCKKIRDSKNEWHQMEKYIIERSDISFSHGVCPECYRTVMEPQIQAMENSGAVEEILKGVAEGGPHGVSPHN